MSKQRTADERAAFERCHRRPACQMQIAPLCSKRNEHAHHRQMESQGGPTTDDNLLACCRYCHWHVHNVMSRVDAVAAGFIIPSWADVTPFGAVTS